MKAKDESSGGSHLILDVLDSDSNMSVGWTLIFGQYLRKANVIEKIQITSLKYLNFISNLDGKKNYDHFFHSTMTKNRIPIQGF